jgi:hypothetical protein
MAKKIVFIVFSFLFLLSLKYLVTSSPPFPPPPPDAVASMEPADTETPFRRAYFTNYTREQIIAHYKAHFERSIMLELVYPPEDAQTLIRDQTRSYYLEELVHPFRESLFINGFIPQAKKDDIWYQGQHFEEKITIRYVPSGVVARVGVFGGMVLLSWVLLQEWGSELRIIVRLIRGFL